MRLGIWIALILTVLSAHADGNWRLVWQPAESAIQDFKELAKCEARIWPGFSLKGQTIVVIDETRDDQLALDYDSGRKFKVSLATLPAKVRSGYSFFKIDGKPWMSISKAYNKIDSNPHSIFRLGVHEAFHRLGQSDWIGTGGSRGEQIPIFGEPRFYRAMLSLNLKEAFIHPESRTKFLGRARHWYDKWRTEFPMEAKAAVDASEGSAEYIELIAYGLIQKGCVANESTLRQFAVEEVKKLNDLLSGFGVTELDNEAYVIPQVAGLILRFDAKIGEWESRHLKGKASAIDILLENVKPIAESANSDDLQSFIDTAELKQEQADGLLAATRERINKSDSIYLSIPVESKPGATEYSTFYYDTQTKIRYSIFYKPEVFQFGNLGKLESMEGLTAVTREFQFRCSRAGWVVPVFNDEVKMTGTQFAIDSEQIKGSAQGTIYEENGYRWICLGE